ncbi:MAG: hypothetical protein ACJ711_11295 [Ornithinibacter sp.]
MAKVHPRFGTPYLITIATVVLVMLLAGFVPLAAHRLTWPGEERSIGRWRCAWVST